MFLFKCPTKLPMQTSFCEMSYKLLYNLISYVNSELFTSVSIKIKKINDFTIETKSYTSINHCLTHNRKTTYTARMIV